MSFLSNAFFDRGLVPIVFSTSTLIADETGIDIDSNARLRKSDRESFEKNIFLGLCGIIPRTVSQSNLWERDTLQTCSTDAKTSRAMCTTSTISYAAKRAQMFCEEAFGERRKRAQ